MDMNAGVHLSNHVCVSYLSEYLSAFLESHGQSMFGVYDYRLLFANLEIKFTREVIYPATITIQCTDVEVKSRKIALHIEQFVDNQTVAKAVLALSFMKDGKVAQINDKIASLFLGTIEQ
ncbi:hypothetical protein VMF7928_00151 [Vibrio marisflavi CECT 7928]|uniref:Thioesterase n=2 Tax=Vibrio marisflavi TaxID=1216040 RepID=A0ABM8ZYN1_9VIBR|nr:hypothetical protein VMF7928_00151 [Vibrio marisflavi CECT 7928]